MKIPDISADLVNKVLGEGAVLIDATDGREVERLCATYPGWMGLFIALQRGALTMVTHELARGKNVKQSYEDAAMGMAAAVLSVLEDLEAPE